MTLTRWQKKLEYWKKHPEEREEFNRKKAENARKKYQEKKNDPEFMQKKRDINKKWRDKNPDKVKLYKKNYVDKYPDKVKAYLKESHKRRYTGKYKEDAKERSRIRHHKLKNDPEFIKKRKEQNARYRKENVQKIKDYWKNYGNDPEFIKKRTEWMRERYANNIQFKLSRLIRGRLYKVISNEQKIGSAVDDLGCTLEELKTHLENQFEEGMTWDNWSKKGWHIDHIKPLSKFDLTDSVQFKEAVHYTNLQPLWWIDNLKKGDKEEDEL